MEAVIGNLILTGNKKEEVKETKVENTTDMPEPRLREIIDFVRPNNLPTSVFTVKVTNSSMDFAGKCYTDGTGYTARPTIIARVSPNEKYPYKVEYKSKRVEKTYYLQDKNNGKENEQKVRDRLMTKVHSSINREEALFCIGYYFPVYMTIEGDFAKPVYFSHAKLQRIDFSSAKFSEVSFDSAKFSEVSFASAKFSEVSFASARFSGGALFSSARFDRHHIYCKLRRKIWSSFLCIIYNMQSN